MERDGEDAALEEFIEQLDRAGISCWRLIHALARRQRFVYDAIGVDDVRDAYLNVTGSDAASAEIERAFDAFSHRHALGLVGCDTGELERWLENYLLARGEMGP